MVKFNSRRGALSLVPAALAALVGCHSASRGPSVPWQRNPRCVSCETPNHRLPDPASVPSESPPSDSFPNEEEALPAPVPPQAKSAPEPKKRTLLGIFSKEPAPQRNSVSNSRSEGPAEKTTDSFQSEQPRNEFTENEVSSTQGDRELRRTQSKSRSSNSISFEDLEAEMNPRRQDASWDGEPFGLADAPTSSSDEDDPMNGNLEHPASITPPDITERPVATSPLPAMPGEIEPWPYRVNPRETPGLDSSTPSNDDPPLYPHAPASVQPAGRELPRLEGQWKPMTPTTPPDPARKWLDQGQIQGLFPLPAIQPGPVRKSL